MPRGTDPQSLGPQPLSRSVVTARFEGPKGSAALRDTGAGEMGFCLAEVGSWEGPLQSRRAMGEQRLQSFEDDQNDQPGLQDPAGAEA